MAALRATSLAMRLAQPRHVHWQVFCSYFFFQLFWSIVPTVARYGKDTRDTHYSSRAASFRGGEEKHARGVQLLKEKVGVFPDLVVQNTVSL